MRKYDKKLKIQKANILAEKRYLESKGLISESFHSPDGTPIGVNRNHEPIGSGAESQDDATIISRIEVLKDALRGVELSGDEEQANSIRVLIQDLKNELDSRKNIDRDAFGREINENKDKEKEEAWKKFQKDNYVTDKTVKAAWRDFEKEWENKK